MGWDSVHVITTYYGLDGPGIESWWGRDVPHPSRLALGPTQPPIRWVLGLFPECEAAGAWHSSPTPSTAEVKGRVELYLYSPSESSWAILGWTLPLPFMIRLTVIVQCVQKVTVHLQNVLEVIERTIVSKNWIKQLHTLLILHFNRCLTTEYSETTAHFNGNFNTDNQIYVP
jgi:hypothetical protein